MTRSVSRSNGWPGIVLVLFSLKKFAQHDHDRSSGLAHGRATGDGPEGRVPHHLDSELLRALVGRVPHKVESRVSGDEVERFTNTYKVDDSIRVGARHRPVLPQQVANQG